MRSPAQIALSVGVVALGVLVAGVTATLPSEGGYAGNKHAERDHAYGKRDLRRRAHYSLIISSGRAIP